MIRNKKEKKVLYTRCIVSKTIENTVFKEYPEYIGVFLLEFFISNKKIPVKNDQYIQGTP